MREIRIYLEEDTADVVEVAWQAVISDEELAQALSEAAALAIDECVNAPVEECPMLH